MVSRDHLKPGLGQSGVSPVPFGASLRTNPCHSIKTQTNIIVPRSTFWLEMSAVVHSTSSLNNLISWNLECLRGLIVDEIGARVWRPQGHPKASTLGLIHAATYLSAPHLEITTHQFNKLSLQADSNCHYLFVCYIRMCMLLRPMDCR